MQPFSADLSIFERMQNAQNVRTGYGHLAGFNDVEKYKEQNSRKRAVANSSGCQPMNVHESSVQEHPLSFHATGTK